MRGSFLTVAAGTHWVARTLSLTGDRLDRNHLANAADRATKSGSACLQRYEVAADATRTLFAASEHVEEDEWNLFTRDILDRRRYPALSEPVYFDARQSGLATYSTRLEADGEALHPALLAEPAFQESLRRSTSDHRIVLHDHALGDGAPRVLSIVIPTTGGSRS